MRFSQILFLVISLIIFNVGFAGEKPLPADDAFAFSVTPKNNKELIVTWNIAPNYYLYKKLLKIKTDPENVAITLPSGLMKPDARGEMEVYHGKLAIPVSLKEASRLVKVSVSYQGCSEYGFCYPPTEKNITLNTNEKSISINQMASLLTDQNSVRNLLVNQNIIVILLIFASLGLLLSLTPCVLPMIPILTSIIVGQQQISSKKAFSLSLTYVLGMAFAYAIAGFIAALIGSSLQVWLQQPFIIMLASLLIAFFAFSLFGFYELSFPSAWQNKISLLSNKQRGGTLGSVFIMGILSTLFISPCTTAPLIGVLMYISQTGNLLLGTSTLFVMGLGMGVPLLIIGSSAGKYLPKTGPWMIAIKKSFGFLMLGLSIFILSRFLDEKWTNLLSSLLLLGIAYFFCSELPKLIGFKKLNRFTSALLSIASLWIIFSSLFFKSTNVNSQISSPGTFLVVHDMKTLNKELASAKAANRPVILDFYADWCESCVEMDKNVFNQPNVKQALNQYALLRADLTNNTPEDQALLKKYEVIAPPTVLFFNHSGREINSSRVVGEVSKNEFIKKINLAVSANCSKDKEIC